MVIQRIRKLWLYGVLATFLCMQLCAQSVAPVSESAHGPNLPDQENKHYAVLVSLDGFRYDCAQRYGARNLQRLAAQGASAPRGMIPVYPSVTFPNHYSIVTGLYPEHHGIVAMSLYDPKRKRRYAHNDPTTVNHGIWYGGIPLWTLAEQQGMRATYPSEPIRW